MKRLVSLFVVLWVRFSIRCLEFCRSQSFRIFTFFPRLSVSPFTLHEGSSQNDKTSTTEWKVCAKTQESKKEKRSIQQTWCDNIDYWYSRLLPENDCHPASWASTVVLFQPKCRQLWLSLCLQLTDKEAMRLKWLQFSQKDKLSSDCKGSLQRVKKTRREQRQSRNCQVTFSKVSSSLL